MSSKTTLYRRDIMKHLSLEKLAETVIAKRKAAGMSQTALSEKTGINRTMFTRLEAADYSPSVDQLLALSDVLGFDYTDLFVEDSAEVMTVPRKKVAVAGTGYVGLSLAVLLSQHHDVTAVDIIPEKVEKLNNWTSPIQDDYIEKYLAEHEERKLSLIKIKMIAELITRARLRHEKIVHEPELIPLSEIALKTVAANYLMYKKELLELEPKYRFKIYDLMSVEYDIEDLYPFIDYEPFWERACRNKYKSDDCSISGNSWKQLYVETYVKELISNFKAETEDEEALDNLKRVCDMIKYSVFNLDIPTFSYKFDISFIPQYFINLTNLSLKYSPILKEIRTRDVFTKNLEPIGDEYSQFGMRIPDLKKFCILITDLSYFLTLSLQGNLVDDEMIKWLVPGLITNQTLRNLDLSNNRITGKGMIKICSYLVRTKALLSINLNNNLIGGDSSYAVGLVLKENTKLRTLLLGMNRFDDESGGRILKMLCFNNYLDELDLSANQLGEESLKFLQISLKANNTIKKMDLCHNDILINDELIKIAEAHPLLIELNLHHTGSDEEKIKKLDSILIKKSVKLHLAQNKGK